jgi:hypothetical protein
MEGPSWRIVTFMPEPWQPGHLIDAPDFEPLLKKEESKLNRRFWKTYSIIWGGQTELTPCT